MSVRMDQDNSEIEISKLGKGQYFGELALVTHRPRAASVYATGGVVKLACKSAPARAIHHILCEHRKPFNLLYYNYYYYYYYRDSLMELLCSVREHLMRFSFIVFHFSFCFFFSFISSLCTRSLTRHHLHLNVSCVFCIFCILLLFYLFRVLVVLLCCVVCKQLCVLLFFCSVCSFRRCLL